MKVLYITYDGILDQLGGSQILPYIYGIAKNKNKVHILSFEKKVRYCRYSKTTKKNLSSKSIDWTPLSFTSGLGIIGKIFDLFKMYITALVLNYSKSFDVIHARGHISAEVGLFLKNLFKTKLIFDFRGLWVDERVDKGGWKLSRPIDRLQYLIYKRKERKLLRSSDRLVVLTKSVIPELLRLGVRKKEKITVIPCCSDFDHFKIFDSNLKHETRASIGIPKNAFVIGYLGSVGKMYRLDAYLDLFSLSLQQRNDIFGLVITNQVSEFSNLIREYNKKLSKNLIIIPAERNEVPRLLSCIDVITSFIEPTYSKISSSPTKIAEAFAEGIPVISNTGIGDTEEIISFVKGGLTIPDFSYQSIKNAYLNLDNVAKLGGLELRQRSKTILSLKRANSLYRNVYKDILCI